MSKDKNQVRGEIKWEVDVCLSDGGRVFLVFTVTVYIVMESNVSSFIRDF